MLETYKKLTKEALERAYAELGTLNAVGRRFGVSSPTIKRYMVMHGLDSMWPDLSLRMDVFFGQLRFFRLLCPQRTDLSWK